MHRAAFPMKVKVITKLYSRTSIPSPKSNEAFDNIVNILQYLKYAKQNKSCTIYLQYVQYVISNIILLYNIILLGS